MCIGRRLKDVWASAVADSRRLGRFSRAAPETRSQARLEKRQAAEREEKQRLREERNTEALASLLIGEGRSPSGRRRQLKTLLQW